MRVVFPKLIRRPSKIEFLKKEYENEYRLLKRVDDDLIEGSSFQVDGEPVDFTKEIIQKYVLLDAGLIKDAQVPERERRERCTTVGELMEFDELEGEELYYKYGKAYLGTARIGTTTIKAVYTYLEEGYAYTDIYISCYGIDLREELGLSYDPNKSEEELCEEYHSGMCTLDFLDDFIFDTKKEYEEIGIAVIEAPRIEISEDYIKTPDLKVRRDELL